MQNTIEIEYPSEVLIGFFLDADRYAILVEEKASIDQFDFPSLKPCANKTFITTQA